MTMAFELAEFKHFRAGDLVLQQAQRSVMNADYCG